MRMPPAPEYPLEGAEGGGGGAWAPAPAIPIKFDPQALQNRASFGRLFPHFGQFIVFPFVETIQSDQGAPGAGDTVIQNNSIDEARRLGILGTARGAHITSRFSL